MTDPAAAPSLTIAHQGLAAALAVVALDVRGVAIEDQILILREILPQAHGDGPMAEALIAAASQILTRFPGRAQRDGGAMAWTLAKDSAAQAVASYYRQRAAACHDRIFPQPV